MVAQLPTSGFNSIYSPETIGLIESTGLNTTPGALSELGETMDDTAMQAMSTLDSMWGITTTLVAAVKKDEARYVKDARKKYAEEVTGDANKRKRFYDWSDYARIEQEATKTIQQSEKQDNARIWYLAQDESVWKTTAKLTLAEQLSSHLSKEELYLAVDLSTYVGSPDYATLLSQTILELREQVGETNFKKLCSALIAEGKENAESANLQFGLLHSLKTQVGENFKLGEAILKETLKKSDRAWVLEGVNFYKNDEHAYKTYFKVMRELVEYQESNMFLGEKASSLLSWLPICGSSIRRLETLKSQVPLGHLRQYGSSDNEVAKLAEDPEIFEKMQLAFAYWGKRPERAWHYEEHGLILALKKRTLAECEALLTWAKTNKEINKDKEENLCGIRPYHMLGGILRQAENITKESLETWAEEFKKITAFMQEEFARFKTDRDYMKVSLWEIEELSLKILHYGFHATLEQVKRTIEAYRDLQRTHQPDIVKEEWGRIGDWLANELVWRLSPEELEEVKVAYQKLPAEKITPIIGRVNYVKGACEDHHTFIQCIEMLSKHRPNSITEGLTYISFKEIYAEDMEKMDQVLTVLDEMEGEDVRTLHKVAELDDLYGKDIHKLSVVVHTLNPIARESNQSIREEKLNAVKALNSLYGNDLEKLGAVVVVLNELQAWEAGIGSALVILKGAYNGEVGVMKQVGLMLVNYHIGHPDASLSDFARQIEPFSELIKEKPERVEAIGEYLEETTIIDEKTVKKFISAFENEGKEAASTYLRGLKKKAKGLVGSRIPEEQRAMDEYDFLVRYVYPKGNYSDHERNLKCGDHLGHIEGYDFDRKGYPVALSGLLGYGLKEGERENPALLEAYSARLQKMRTFVSSRGPDSKALQEAFDKKIEKIFQEKAAPAFKEIEGLATKEKLFCLIVSEALRKAKELGLGGGRSLRTEESKVFLPDEEVLDLVVEYKYAYHEDLEAYVQRSADDAKQYGDAISQNYILWSELSVIYGENMKHVMRNDILEKIADEPHFGLIVDSYVKSIGELTTDDSLLGKARERVQSTLGNERIPADKKPEVLWKQMWSLFSSNLKFANPDQEKAFEAKLREASAPFLAEPTIENFEAAYSNLLAARNERRFDIAAKVEDLLSRDIGLIFKEVAKYEELAEVEEKETHMNGPKDKAVKKSSKKRNIRGHITKTQESANARMGAYLCIAGDGEMWKNPNYFEMVLEDEESNRCVGVVMMLKIAAEDGKKYLWFGPNPFESFLTQVSAKKTYDYMYKTVCKFAEENGFDGVVVPSNENQIFGACTNRGGEFPGFIKASRLKDEKGSIKVVKFGKEHILGGNYGYKDGALIWEKTLKKP